MKNYIAIFHRSNSQLKNGGYRTEFTIEAQTIASARKKAREIESGCVYGSLSLIEVKPAEQE